MTQEMAAGWYPDPNMVGSVRYWDGTQWTQAVAPTPQPAAQPVVAQSDPTHAYRAITIVLLVVGLVVAGVGFIMLMTATTAGDCMTKSPGSIGGTRVDGDCVDEMNAESNRAGVVIVIGLAALALSGLIRMVAPKRRT